MKKIGEKIVSDAKFQITNEDAKVQHVFIECGFLVSQLSSMLK